MSHSHRYFFCLRPSPMLARFIGAVREAQGRFQTIVPDERLHMTLAITDDFAEHRPEVAEQMLWIGETVSAEPMTISLDQINAGSESVALKPSKRPAALGILQSQLWRRLDFRGLGREGWSFNPHVTLGYRSGLPIQQVIPPLRWDVAEFALIHSLVGATRHEVLGRWELEKKQLDLLAL